MSYRGPKAKLSRALGVPLTTKAAAVMNRRPNPPGQHGGARRRTKSGYAEQLLEKQRLRFQYNVREKQLRAYYEKAKRKKGNTGSEFLRILELRLDSFILRAGYAPSIFAARQIVVHGHIDVNGKKVDRPGYQLDIGDIVSLSEKAKAMNIVSAALTSATPPPYIEYIGADKHSANFVRQPSVDEIPVICRVNMVVEYYNR